MGRRPPRLPGVKAFLPCGFCSHKDFQGEELPCLFPLSGLQGPLSPKPASLLGVR